MLGNFDCWEILNVGQVFGLEIPPDAAAALEEALQSNHTSGLSSTHIIPSYLLYHISYMLPPYICLYTYTHCPPFYTLYSQYRSYGSLVC